MKNISRIFCALILASSSILIKAANIALSKDNGKVVLFNANKNSIDEIANYTAKWKEGSDLLPKTKLVQENAESWVEFTYSGKKGMGLSRIDIPKNSLSKLRGDQKVYEGIKVKINYNGKEFEKITVKISFCDKTILGHTLSLEKGTKVYDIRKGFRRAKYPPDWDNIKLIAIVNDKPGMKFMLQKITMIEEEGKNEIKTLKITETKKTKEIFPAEYPIFKDDKINPECFKNAAELSAFYEYRKKEAMKDSPLKARICYDEKNLAIETKAEFPTPPKADLLEHDSAVWQDEGLEFFFSSQLDNNKKIQFVSNAKGTCFDYIRDYDDVAARIINIIPWNLPHKKDMEYKNGIWETQIAFPLQELKIDLSKKRITGFQLAQNYHKNKYKAEKYNTLSWTCTDKFPKPENFGLLIFNKKTFGAGEASINKIQSFEKNEKFIDLTINFSLKDFKPGNYKLKKHLAAADYTRYEQEENINVEKTSSEFSTKMTSVKNLNGTYSLCLSFYNENNDIKAVAVNFENATPLKEMFGKKIFCPDPKQVTWKEGSFNAGDCHDLMIPAKASARTKKTAEIFAEQLYGFTGSKYKISEGKEKIANTIELKISKGNLKKEGYAITVSPEKVTITGADEAGLYYGCVTFMQLVKMPMKFQDKAPVQCVEIQDYPDVPNRMMRLPHPWNFKDRKFLENRKIEFLMDWINKFVANNKFNRLWLDVSHLTRFKRRPEFNGTERIYSLEDLERLGEFCRDRFVEIIPAFQVGGHANWWLLQYHPELREKGYKNMSDYTHPEHNKIVFDCMLDVIEATKAKYATPKTDECWHVKHPDETPDEKLRGKTRPEAFLEFHTKLNNFLKERGVKMVIYEDMLNPRHNGKRYDLYKVIDKFPKDVIIGQWGGASPDITTEYFVNNGFEVWGNVTNYWSYGEKGKKLANGFGVTAYGLGLGWRLYRDSVSYSAYIQFYGANQSWNMKREDDPGLIDEIASGKLVALREMYALEPNPKASEKIIPINIDANLNSSWINIIQKKYPDISIENAPSGKCEIGNIPTLIKGDKSNCAIIGDGAKLEFPAKGKFSSLIFLHTGYVTPEGAKKFKVSWRKWIYGYPLGDYFVHYSDGTKEKLPVRLKRNIDWMDVNPLFRATVENRYILPVKLSNGNYNFLYQWEWVNPHPQKEIIKVSYEDDKHFDFNLLLFAISGRKVRN